MIKTENNLKSIEIANIGFINTIRPLLVCGHTVRFRVKGISMRPVLEDGRDEVVLAFAEKVVAGDLVLAQVFPGRYVLHRVLRKEMERLTLMGDGNLKITEECLSADVVGKVVLLVRKGRCIRTYGLPFRIYSAIWTRLNPLRRYLLAFYKLTGGRYGRSK